MKATQAWEQQVQSGNASQVQTRFFEPKGWTEELYDMQTDPDSVHNLIDDPTHQQTVVKLRTELRRQQIKFFDAGLIPESEMVKLAAKQNLTIYDFVRDPKLYDVPALIDAADVALKQDKANLPKLAQQLKNPNVGIRYWAAVGCFLLNDADSVAAYLNDESHEVRAIAAWTSINAGDKDAGVECLKHLLEQKSYASLTVLNIVDWLGEDAKGLMPTVRALSPEKKSYEQRLRLTLMEKFP